LNLTSSLLLSTLKYPWTWQSKPVVKKIGIFDMEQPIYEAACSAVGGNPEKAFPSPSDGDC
jgi:hypothetical protein